MSYLVINETTDEVILRTPLRCLAEVTEAERNADWPNGSGPFVVIFDVDPDNDPHPDPDDAYDPD
jgi:hypothetical protein